VVTGPEVEEFFGVWAQTALPKIANKQIAIESLLIILGLLLVNLVNAAQLRPGKARRPADSGQTVSDNFN
jgi:hypothetical protein